MDINNYILPEGEIPIKETLSLWKGKHHYFRDFDSAVVELAQDIKCKDCGNPTGNKYYLLCEACRNKKSAEKYFQLEYREWDGETPLWLYDTDIYFFSEEEVVDYAYEVDTEVADLKLIIAKPLETPYFDIEEFLYEKLEIEPEYMESVISDSEIEEINDSINETILNSIGKTLNVWAPGKYRTSFINNKE